MSNFALLVSGQPRCFKSSYLSLKKEILDKLSLYSHAYDIFISTWLKSPELEYGRLNAWRYENEGSIDEFIELFKPKDARVDYYNLAADAFFQNLQDKYPSRTGDNHAKRFSAQFYRIWSCYDLARIYRLERSINYDYFIRLRPDLRYKDNCFENVLKQLDKESIFIDPYGNQHGAGDCFAIGSKEVMSEYSNLINHLEEYGQEGVPINCEIILDYHLKKQNINWKPIRVVDGVIRPPNSNL